MKTKSKKEKITPNIGEFILGFNRKNYTDTGNEYIVDHVFGYYVGEENGQVIITKEKEDAVAFKKELLYNKDYDYKLCNSFFFLPKSAEKFINGNQ